MPHDDAARSDAPSADQVDRNYLETCRRRRVAPMPRDQVQELSAEWAGVIARGGIPPIKRGRSMSRILQRILRASLPLTIAACSLPSTAQDIAEMPDLRVGDEWVFHVTGSQGRQSS